MIKLEKHIFTENDNRKNRISILAESEGKAVKIVKNKYQDRITEYLFCKKFSCPPFPSLNVTPPNIVDEFIVIDNEYNLCLEKKKMENVKNA